MAILSPKSLEMANQTRITAAPDLFLVTDNEESMSPSVFPSSM